MLTSHFLTCPVLQAVMMAVMRMLEMSRQRAISEDTVHWSGSTRVRWVPTSTIGSRAMSSRTRSSDAPTRMPVIRHLGTFVHRRPYPMPGILTGTGGSPVLRQIRWIAAADIANPVAGPHLLDADIQRFLGHSSSAAPQGRSFPPRP
jgi:hypothetical protein